MRLQNMAGGKADHTMTVDSAISMRNEELSNRSGSSDGSLNKRGIKSNVALQNKKIQLQSAQGKYFKRYVFSVYLIDHVN